MLLKLVRLMLMGEICIFVFDLRYIIRDIRVKLLIIFVLNKGVFSVIFLRLIVNF